MLLLVRLIVKITELECVVYAVDTFFTQLSVSLKQNHQTGFFHINLFKG